jgi:ribonuclease R
MAKKRPPPRFHNKKKAHRKGGRPPYGAPGSNETRREGRSFEDRSNPAPSGPSGTEDEFPEEADEGSSKDVLPATDAEPSRPGLPSERAVLARLTAQGKRPHSLDSLAEAFDVPAEMSRDFARLMRRMEEAGKVRRVKGRKYVAAADSASRRDEGSRSAGYDFAAGEGKPRESRWDRGGRKGRGEYRSRHPGQEGGEGPDGRGRSGDGLVKGKLVRHGGFHFLQAMRAKDGELGEDAVLIPKRNLGKSRAGDIVTVRIVEDDDGERIGRVIGTLGHDIDFQDVARAFYKEYRVPQGYPKKAISEAASFPEPVFDHHEGREDYRDRKVITIDPSTAKDHDDAISLEKTAKGTWMLGVHIADVTEYVLPDSELDAESLKRAFTQYLPWTAAPMLPQRLSSDLCSLLEHRERLAFSCIMEVDGQGELLSFDFVETFIRVEHFYSYEEAQGAKDAGDPFLASMDEFTAILKDKRRRDGFIDFQFPEPKVELDANGVPARIYPGQRLASHSWIEECMLLANQATAKYLTKHKLPGLFRVHEQPDLDAVAALWSSQGIHKDKGMADAVKRLGQSKNHLNPAVQGFFIRLLSQEGGALPASVQRKILQSMKKAQYSAESLGHFALGWLHYAHFTSPIRRYADLWTHRVIKAHLRGQKVGRNMKAKAASVAEAISETEIAVMKTERKGLKTATAWVLRQYIGDEFVGEVSGAENFGLFVSITDPYGEGLVPIRLLKDDYYEKDEETGHLVGRRTGNRFELGDKVKVRLERSDPFTSQVDFSYLGRA